MRRFTLSALAGLMLAGAATGALTGCAGDGGDLSAQARTTLGQAVAAYGIARGIADTAVAADPTLVAPVAGLETTLNPKLAQAQAMLVAREFDAGAADALGQQIEQQVVMLETATAARVKVIAHR